MGIWKRLFGGTTGASAAADAKRSPSAGTWHEHIDFVCFTDQDEQKRFLVDAVNGGTADRVLIVGGTWLFREGDERLFPGRECFINGACSLGALCAAVETMRERNGPSVVISNYPVRTDPPSTAWIEMPAGTERRWSAPKRTSLALCRKGSEETVAVYFAAVHETSYYETVLKSQGSSKRRPVACAVVSDGRIDLAVDDRIEISETANEEVRARILIRTSELLESLKKENGSTVGILCR